MSKLSFKTFCIELCKESITEKTVPMSMPLFRTSGLLDLFETDYDNLHSMSMEYLMQYFDEYLKDFIVSLPAQNSFLYI